LYYVTLKWIENVAVGLWFQNEEVEQKITNSIGGSNNNNDSGVYRAIKEDSGIDCSIAD